MPVHLRPLAVYVTLALVSAPLRGQTPIPNTPAGQALRAFLDAFNSADSTRVAAFLSTYQVGFPFRNLFNFRQMTGGFDLLRVEVRPAMPDSATSIGIVTCRSISSAEAPGYWATTSMIAGAGSGYASTLTRTKA